MLRFNHFYHLFEKVWPIAASMRVWSRTILLLGLVWLMSVSPAQALWKQTFFVDGTGSIMALAIDKNDHLYAGGSFTSIGGVKANNIAKWDGEKWTALGSGRESPVGALVVDSVGDVYTLEKGTQVVAKWDHSGWSWSTLDLEGLILPKYQQYAYANANFKIEAMVIDDSDNLYLGGTTSFNSADGYMNTVNIIKYKRDSSTGKYNFSRNVESVERRPNTLILQSLINKNKNNLFLGVLYKCSGGECENDPDRGWLIETSKNVDMSTNTGMTFEFGSSGLVSASYHTCHVCAMVASSSGPPYYIGGKFMSSTTGRNNLLRLDNNGNSLSLGNGLSGGQSYIYALTLDSKGNLYAGGDFRRIGQIVSNNIARWNGNTWSALGTGTTSPVTVLVNDSQDNLYVAAGAKIYHWAPEVVNLSSNAQESSEATPEKTVTFTITTPPQVEQDETVDFVVEYQNTTNDDYVLSASQFTILKGKRTGSITLTVQNDDISEKPPQTVTIRLTNPSAGLKLGTDTFQTLTIIDDDTAGVTTTPANVNVTEGKTTGSYTVRLNSKPLDTVTIHIAPDDQSTVNPSSLTFTVTDWNVPQTITVSAEDDSVKETSPHISIIKHTVVSNDVSYEGLPVSDVTVNVYETEQAFTTLYLELSSPTVLFNDKNLQITGKLNRFPLKEGQNLEGKAIKLHITQPNGQVITLERTTTTDTGQFTIKAQDPDFPALNQEGAYRFSVEFTGNADLVPASSTEQTLLVGRSAGYVLLVQGKIPNEEGLTAHNKTTNRIYNHLKKRGFEDNNIQYLNYTAGQAGVDGIPSKATLQTALQTLQQRMNTVPAPFYLIMVDHGGIEGHFYIDNNGDHAFVTAQELAGWLETFESGLAPEAVTEQRIVIMGACYSGQFIPALSKAGRTIITSAANNEVSYKGPHESDGIRSGELFMEEFFHSLSSGKSFATAFEVATEVVERMTRQGGSQNSLIYQDNALQHPLLDDNGDQRGSNILSAGGDGRWANNAYFGAVLPNSTNYGGEPAKISAVTETLFLTAEQSTASLWAIVNNANRVNAAPIDIRLPTVVLPQTATARTEQQAVDQLQRISTMGCTQQTQPHRCLTLGTFDEPGQYELFYFVRDSVTQEISPIKRSIVYKNYGGNQAPLAPTLDLPAEGATPQTTLLFNWLATTDPEGHRLTYTLEIATDGAFSQLIYRQEELTRTLTSIDGSTLLLDGTRGLKDKTTYYWRVLAIDDYGAIGYSQVRSFETNDPNTPPNIGIIEVMSALDYRAIEIKDGDVTVIHTKTNEPISPLADTKESGHYRMILPAGVYAVTVNCQDYLPAQVTLDVSRGSTTVQVMLQPTSPPTPGVLQFLTSQLEIAENTTTPQQVLVERVLGSYGAVSVQYNIVAETATADSDYVGNSGTLTWADGDKSSQSITFTLRDDTVYEGNETFSIQLANPVGATLGTNTQLQVTITDDETAAPPVTPPVVITPPTNEPPNAGNTESAMVSFSKPIYTVSEGQVWAPITVICSNNCGRVQIAVVAEADSAITEEAPATKGDDYVLDETLLVWPKGDTNPITFDVFIKDDQVIEAQESLILKIVAVEGATIGDIGQAVVNIVDNDPLGNDDSKEPTPPEPPKEPIDPKPPEEPDPLWILPNINDDSGFAISIDRSGKFGSSKSTFKGGVSLEKDDFTTIRTVARKQRFTVATIIEVDPADRGKLADLLCVIGTEPPAHPPAVDKDYDGGIDTVYETINAHNKTTPIDLYAEAEVWMAQFTEPFESQVTLEREISLTLWDNKPLNSSGMYYFFVGYRLDDGLIVYVSRPIMVEVR